MPSGEKKESSDTSDRYAKSTTRQAIIERSGTVFTAGSDPKDKARQLMDAENRLRSGGGLFGKKAGIDLLNTGKSESGSVSVGMPINPYLWKASIETIDFMPLSSADPFGGTIITDWYSGSSNSNERCKINIFIKGVELKTDNLKLNSFCQKLDSGGIWRDITSNPTNDAKLENAILNAAKKYKIALN